MLQRRGLYGLGDAQIDAQNNVVRTMTRLMEELAAARSSGSITRTMIYNALSEMQNAITAYGQMYGGTDRGKAGLNDLWTLYYRLERDHQAEINSLPESYAPSYVPSAPTGDLNASPVMTPYNPAIDYTINVGTSGNAASTAGNLQPSQTPGPPAGVTVPQDSPAPSIFKNPLTFVAIGVALLYVIKKGGNS